MAARIQIRQRRNLTAQDRESGWNTASAPAPLPTYDALRDSNLRQYFESRTIQKFLQNSGWIDKEGKIVDLDKFRGKLNIIEQEFKYAEKTEFWRLKEEEDMRRTIQVKRERALIEAKKLERARKIKEENRIRKGLISAVRNQPTSGMARLNVEPSSPGSRTQGSSPAITARGGELEQRGGGGGGGGAQGPAAGGAKAERGEIGDGGGFFVTQAQGD